MEKALKIGKVSATGSLRLFIGVAVSTVIMAIGTIVLARLMSPEEYGLYTIALIPSMMINLFRDWGVNSAITKHVASLKASGREQEIRDIILGGLVFEVATGLLLSFLSVGLAGVIAVEVFHRPESARLISVISVAVFSGSLLVASLSAFVGFERMGLNSFTIICQSIVKSIVGPLLVILGYGVLGAALGYTLSFLAAGFIGVAVLYFVLYRNLRRSGSRKASLPITIKAMLKYGVPLSASPIVAGVLVQFYGFMMAFSCSDAIVGNYQVASNFAVLLTFFTIPISTVLFPAFAKLDPQKEHQLMKDIFASSVKYTAILLVPATMAIMVLPGPMISTLYGGQYVFAPFFLSLYVIGNLFALLGNLSLGSFLTGVGETKTLMKQSILTLAIGLPLGFLLIPTFGVIGLILASLLAGLPSMFWGLHWAWKHYRVKADFKCSAKTFTASTVAAIPTYALLSFINMAEWAKLVVGITIFLAIYIFTAPIIGAVTQTDISNIRTMFSGLGVVSRIINIPLKAAEKAAQIKPRNKK
jgi:O-antigen/teichoic acid export membrane protein